MRNTHSSNGRRSTRAIAAAAMFAGSISFCHAADKSWAGGTGLWQTGPWLNTSGTVTTAAGTNDNAHIISSSPLTVTRDLSSGNLIGLGTVNVDGTLGGPVTLSKLGATTFGASNILIGINGNAAADLAGGTITATNIVAGQNVNGAGSIAFSGSLLQTATLTVGNAGIGSFYHNSGTVNFTSTLTIGNSAGGTGFYSLAGGTLLAQSNALTTTVGASGFGQFEVNGGIGTLGNLSVGTNPGGYGVVNVNSGFLFVNNALRLGLNGTGLFQVFGGQTTIAGVLANGGGSLINYGGDVFITNGVNISGGRVDLGTSAFNVSASNALSIADGYFAANTIGALGGASINFLSGTLVINTGNFNPSGGLLGIGSIVLPQTKTLSVGGTTTLQAAQPLVITGGTFSTGTLAGNTAALQFLSGTFRLTAADLQIATTGLFGDTLTIDSTRRIEVGNGYGANIDSSSQLYITGGALMASGIVANQGVIQLGGPTARLGAVTLSNQGLLAGTGRIIGTLYNISDGEVRVSGAEQLRFDGTDHANDALVSLLGGIADFRGTLANTGRITGRGGLNTTGLDNSGTIALSAGVTDIHGDVTNNASGKIIVSGNANASFWDDVTNSPGGSIKVSPGSVASFFGTYGGAGITGGGSVNFESDITPGFSPAAISIAGNVGFGAGSRLRIELAGTSRGTQYDAIDITGSATLDGQLRLSTLGGFVPLPGMSFNVLTYSSRSNQFEIVNDTGLKGLIFTPTYNATSLQLSLRGIGGDANLDGLVDIRDLYILASHYKQSGQNWLTADFTADGAVNALDLGQLAANWQYGVAGPAQPLDGILASLGLPSSAVPEPAMGISLLGMGILLRRNRKR